MELMKSQVNGMFLLGSGVGCRLLSVPAPRVAAPISPEPPVTSAAQPSRSIGILSAARRAEPVQRRGADLIRLRYRAIA